MRSRLVLAGLTALALAACSDDETTNVTINHPGNGTAVTLRGILVGALYSGDIEVTVGTTGTTSIPVTGCVYLGAAACTALSGTYNNSTLVLIFSSGTPALTFTGTYSTGTGELHGSFTGDDDGEFVVINDDDVDVYCGTFDGDANGTWNFAIAGSSLDGVYDDGSGPEDLSGSVNGNAVSIIFSGGTASGTLSGTSASGNWVSAGNNGTWTGSSSGCRS